MLQSQSEAERYRMGDVLLIQFSNSIGESIKGADLVVAVAVGEMVRKGVWSHTKELNLDMFSAAIAASKPSLKHSTFENLVSPSQRLSLILLPDRLSRHNSVTRRQSTYQALTEVIRDAKKIAVIIAVEDSQYCPALVAAVSRATQGVSRKKDAKALEVNVCFISAAGKPLKSNPDWQVCGETIAWVCQLVDTPPSELNPKTMSDQVRKRFKNLPDVSVSEIIGEKLASAGCGGIFAVGKAAKEEPRMLIFDYHPKSAKQTALICGKGVTFDTGGLSLKISGAMNGMKCDMGGAAAVLGAFELLVRSGFKHRVVAVAGLVENAVSADSVKPDDILTFHSGKTVEINNTDAEGRMVLGDCMSFACRKYQPSVAIDAATLTGAQLVATGKYFGAVISNDERLERLAVDAGKACGDLVAPLPFAPEYFQDEFKSKIADMKNSVADRNNAQTSCAAQFIYSHIDDIDVDWLHIDLAGPAFIGDRATGYGTLLISEVVERYFKRDRN